MMFATGALRWSRSSRRAAALRSAGSSTGRGTQLVVGLAAFFALQLATPWIAGYLLHDPTYAPYLRLAAVIPLFYGIRALYQGYLNGVRRFAAQAWIDIGASVSRMAFVLGGSALGFGVYGAIGGFAAAILMLVVTASWIRPPHDRDARQVGAGALLSFQGKVMLATLATDYLTTLDLLAVKAFVSPDPVVADRLAGYFTASQRLAQIPMTLVVALVYVMFPLIAKQAGTADAAAGARVPKLGMRTMLLLLVPATVILASTAEESLLLVFPSIARTMAETGDTSAVVVQPFQLLVLGYVLYSFLLTATTLITADGRPGVALVIVAATLVLARLFTWQGALAFGPGGAAVGIGAAWLVGGVASAVLLLRRYGTLVPAASAVRIASCGALVWAASAAVHVEGPMLLVKDAALVSLFVLAAVATREISGAELRNLVGAALPRRSGTRA
jgi:O-antigen/teichoic acid export membrane protein